MIYSCKSKFQFSLKEVYTLVALLLGIFSIHAQTLPSGFKLEEITALSYPTCMTMAPDGRIFIGQATGAVRIVKNGILLKTAFYKIPDVFFQLEKGLIGITLDPDFVNNQYVYLHYTHDLQGPVQNRVIRVTGSGDTAVTGSQVSILELDIIPKFIVNYNHDGGGLAFGPDGKLYITSGENTLYCPCTFDLPPDSTSCVPCYKPWPANFSQDMNHYTGKLIRVNPDGSIPSDNPLAGSYVSDLQKRIVAKGLRNPFAIHFRKNTAELYINDVGSSGYSAREETNVYTFDSKKVKNYGWGDVEGYTTAAYLESPLNDYQHELTETFTDTTGCAITGGVYFDPDSTGFPSEYKGKYFYQDFCGGWINIVDFEHGNKKSNFATMLGGNESTTGNGGLGSLALTLGIDGNLYYLTRSGSAKLSGLYKISYSFTTSTLKIADPYEMRLYPNPAETSVNISFTDPKVEIIHLTVLDILSREILNLQLTSTIGPNEITLDLSALSKGLYQLNFKTEDSNITKKLIIE